MSGSTGRQSLLALVIAFSFALAGCGEDGPTTATPNANVAGNYTLTITASTACGSLADEDKVKTYRATITQTGTDFAVNIVADAYSRTTGTVSGNTVSLDVFISDVRDTRNFHGYTLSGSGTGTVAGRNIMGNVNGYLRFIAQDYLNVSCPLTDHKFTFTKR